MQEPEPRVYGGLIAGVEPGSLAAKLGVRAGDVLLEVNGEPVEDVIDVQYYAAEYAVEMTLQRDGKVITRSGERGEMQPLGLSFEHPTFDIDIRRCNNLCGFCFVLQMAPRFRRTLYIKDDDYRYSFLFGHFVTLTNLSEHDEWRIVEQGLSPLYVSVHATDLELRRRCLRNENAPDIVEQMAGFIEEGIEFHTQIVVTPGLNDGPHLERSVRKLAGLYPGVQSVSVVPVGLTKHHRYGMRPNTREEAAVVLDACEAWQAEYREALGVNFVYPTDEWYLVTERPIPPLKAYDGLDLRENGLGMVRAFVEEWGESRGEVGKRAKVESLTLVTGKLFAPVLEKYAAEFAEKSGVRVDVVAVVNERLGETITVAGLLMGEDVIGQVGKRELGEVVVLPQVMFDHPDGIALDDVSPGEVAKALGRPMALADMMGDLIDVVYGRPALYFEPTGEVASEAASGTIQMDGGWAVEKYL
jgi:putative radical SAM enzyme (TIGR03279 family)